MISAEDDSKPWLETVGQVSWVINVILDCNLQGSVA